MRDSINIKQKDVNHFTITREMSETVNRANLEERKRSLDMQIEALEDQLDTLKKNRKALEEALKTGKGSTSKETAQKAVGGE